MSGFRRTISGLNNQHLFHNVDLVVFVEGGPVSYTKHEVHSGRFTEETDDVLFWGNIFSKFLTSKKLKFKSIGSKSVIKEIAADIVSGRLTTLFVAMDNEFDEVMNNRIENNSVFYTFGYSFENDIWNEQVIKSIIEALTAVTITNTEIDDNFQRFLKDIKLAVYADGYLFKRGTSFFPRKSGHLFCVECNPADLPSVKRVDIETKITAKNLVKNSLYSFGSRHSIDPLKFCYGHLLADYCYQLIHHYIKKRHALTSISKDIVHRMGIGKFFQIGFEAGEIHDYYRNQFASKGHLA